MKYFCKAMLAAFVTVAFAMPVIAEGWTWKASGSATGRFYTGDRQDKDNDSDAENLSYTDQDMDSSGSISISSSYSEGDTSASFSVGFSDDDGAFKETYTISGSKKVGDWTGSGSFSVSKWTGWAADADATDTRPGSDDSDSGYVALTDGTMTHKLGETSHLGSSGVSTANIFWNANGEDTSIESSTGASVGSMGGYSLGYKVDDATSVTFAIQRDNAEKACGSSGFATADSTVETYNDAKTTTSKTDGDKGGHSTDCMGLAVSANVGGASIGFTFANGSLALNPTTDTNKTDETNQKVSHGTYGLGVTYPMGDMTFVIGSSNYDRTRQTSTTDKAEYNRAMTLVGVSGKAGDLGWGIQMETGAEKTTNQSSDNTKGDASSIAVGISQAIGSVTLAAGYGSGTYKTTSGGTTDNDNSRSRLGVSLTTSF